MKQYFNFKLFKDGFKQVKTIGLIFLILLTFIFIVIPIGNYIDLQECIKLGITEKGEKIYLNATDFASFLLFPLYIGSFLFTGILFSFLHKRNSSDFYHSIPHKRITLYINYTLSLCAWFALITFAPCIALSIIRLIFSNSFILNIGTLFTCAFNIFVGSLLVIAGTSIACFITGTTLNNVILSIMIVFMPRILIYAFLALITESIQIVENFNNIFILRDDINIVVGFMFGNDEVITTFGVHTIYSLIVAFIYFAIAGYAYVKRNSEAAGNATINKKIERIVLMFVGFIISLPSLILLFEYITSFDEFKTLSPTFIFFIFINICGVVAALFIYQFMTTRKVKPSLRSMLLTPFVIIFDTLFIGVMVLLFNLSLNFSPEANEVDYIKINTSHYGYYYTQYFMEQIDNEEITEPKIIEFVCDTLESNIEDIKNHKYLYRYDSEMTVTICYNGIEYHRRLFMDENTFTKILRESITSNDSYDIFTNIPDINDSDVFIDYDVSLDVGITMTKEIYSVLREEIIANPIPFINYIATYESEDRIIVYFYDDKDDYYEIAVPIIPDYPKSYSIYINGMVNQNKSYSSKAVDILSDVDKHILEADYVYISLSKPYVGSDDVRILELHHSIYVNSELVEYIKDPSSLNRNEYLEMVKTTGYLSDEEKVVLLDIASYVGKTYDDLKSKQLYWLTIEKERYRDNEGIYINVPVIIPDSYVLSIGKE